MNDIKFPPGWDQERVNRVLAHYDMQTEDEAVAEDDAAQPAAPSLRGSVIEYVAPTEPVAQDDWDASQ